jgi:hypothetical protein
LLLKRASASRRRQPLATQHARLARAFRRQEVKDFVALRACWGRPSPLACEQRAPAGG